MQCSIREPKQIHLYVAVETFSWDSMSPQWSPLSLVIKDLLIATVHMNLNLNGGAGQCCRKKCTNFLSKQENPVSQSVLSQEVYKLFVQTGEACLLVGI